MSNPLDTRNGWPEYKMSVIQQLEYLTAEVKDLRGAVIQVDKDLQAMVTRDKLEADISIINAKRDADADTINRKREADLVILNKSRDELRKEIIEEVSEMASRFTKIELDWAAHKGEEEKGRKVWAIIITCITITINVAGLITALVLIK